MKSQLLLGKQNFSKQHTRSYCHFQKDHRTPSCTEPSTSGAVLNGRVQAEEGLCLEPSWSLSTQAEDHSQLQVSYPFATKYGTIEMMHKGICKQSNLSLPRGAIPCLIEYFHMLKELQALRCGDSRSGSYAVFTDGGGPAAQQLVTTQASLKSCLRNHQANGGGTAYKNQDLLISLPFPHKKRSPYKEGGINYA